MDRGKEGGRERGREGESEGRKEGRRREGGKRKEKIEAFISLSKSWT